MPIGWNKINLYIFIVFSFSECQNAYEKKENSPVLQQTIIQWTKTEVLNQKFLAEKKFNDSIPCISSKDSLSTMQKDSLLLNWSKQPEMLKSIIEDVLNKK